MIGERFGHLHPVDVPVGAVMPYAGPINSGTQAILQAQGWLFCDGASYNINDYPQLYAVIGALYGQQAPTGQFYVPDYRGSFLRGVNRDAMRPQPENTVKRDPDVDARLPANANGTGNSGNSVGSLQFDAYLEHEHDYQQVALSPGSGSSTLLSSFSPGTTQVYTTTGSTADQLPETDGSGSGSTSASTSYYVSTSETRPYNVSVNFIIKAQTKHLRSPAAHSHGTCLQDCWGTSCCGSVSENCPPSSSSTP